MMSNGFYMLGWRLQNCNMFATDTQPTQIKTQLGHVYAPSQLQNWYGSPKITDQMKVWPTHPPGK